MRLQPIDRQEEEVLLRERACEGENRVAVGSGHESDLDVAHVQLAPVQHLDDDTRNDDVVHAVALDDDDVARGPHGQRLSRERVLDVGADLGGVGVCR